jgi:hypothetical protein
MLKVCNLERRSVPEARLICKRRKTDIAFEATIFRVCGGEAVADSKSIFDVLPMELIGQNILSQYLTLAELAVFDMALTNRAVRNFFLNVYRFVVVETPLEIKYEQTARWMRMRGVRAKHLKLWHDITKTSLLHLFRLGDHFETVNLMGHQSFSDILLTKLSQCAPNLKTLNLSYCSDITDTGIRVLAGHCRQLEDLTLWGCYELTDATVQVLAASCPRLEHLNLRCCRKISDEGLQAIARGFSVMRTLNFTYCRGITDKGVLLLAAAFPMLARISFAYCVLVTDATVLSLTQRCPQMECLDLTGCDITNQALAFIANSPMGRSLTELHLSTCRNISDLGLQQLGAKCPQLLSLHIAGCDQITLAGLRALPPTCVIHNPA